MALVSQIMGIVERIAPAYLKFEKDKVGLQVGDPNAGVDTVLVALEVTDEVIEEARGKGAQLILTHHPLVFQSLDKVVANDPIGGLVTALIKSDIALGAAHTNLDRARDGVSDALAQALGLQDIGVLVPAGDLQMFKLVVFVPKENVEEMIAALGNAGGGVIGEYSHCTFRAAGTGTFYPMEGAKPYLGRAGELNQVEEYRLEVLASPDTLDRLIKVMLDVHPYEEVAYDVYEVKVPPAGIGFGRVGDLAEPCTLRECARRWEDALGARLKVSGDWDTMVRRVAVCGGSGADLMGAAKGSGADVYVTGDVRYHAAHAARGIGLAIVDAGHAETERLVVPGYARAVQRLAAEENLTVEVIVSDVDTNPWNRD